MSGSEGYTAPEIIGCLESASHVEYTNAVDLWAAGCVTYRLITGRVSFFSGLRSLMKYCEDAISFSYAHLDGEVKRSCHAFVGQLLKPQPIERPSASQALDHPWIASKDVRGLTDPLADPSITSKPGGYSKSTQKAAELPDGLGSTGNVSAMNYNTASHLGLWSYQQSLSSDTVAQRPLSYLEPRHHSQCGITSFVYTRQYANSIRYGREPD